MIARAARTERRHRVVGARRRCRCGVDAPTVSTHGALPGDVMPPYCGCPFAFRPKLPAAVTTTIPASTARRAASVSGSVL